MSSGKESGSQRRKKKAESDAAHEQLMKKIPKLSDIFSKSAGEKPSSSTETDKEVPIASTSTSVAAQTQLCFYLEYDCLAPGKKFCGGRKISSCLWALGTLNPALSVYIVLYCI